MDKEAAIELLKEAAEDFSIAYEFDPHSPQILFNAGRAFEELKDLKQAAFFFEQLLEQEDLPESITSHVNLFFSNYKPEHV